MISVCPTLNALGHVRLEPERESTKTRKLAKNTHGMDLVSD